MADNLPVGTEARKEGTDLTDLTRDAFTKVAEYLNGELEGKLDTLLFNFIKHKL